MRADGARVTRTRRTISSHARDRTNDSKWSAAAAPLRRRERQVSGSAQTQAHMTRALAAYTSMTVGEGRMRAVLSPATTRPMIHAGWPSSADNSSTNACAFSAGRHTMRPPDVSAEYPSMRRNMQCRFSSTASILARIGSVCNSIDTASFVSRARLVRWPRIPKPVTSVAACAPCLCIMRAPLMFRRHMLSVAMPNASATSSSVTTSLIFAHSFGLCRHSCAFTAT
mmetsp:Transcript_7184/g.25658  ORF Transcript_7184/g.25658 Transcript_7184/m.25658 type:complete len:226 (-) Transcript_7184:842-1519(-)